MKVLIISIVLFIAFIIFVLRHQSRKYAKTMKDMGIHIKNGDITLDELDDISTE